MPRREVRRYWGGRRWCRRAKRRGLHVRHAPDRRRRLARPAEPRLCGRNIIAWTLRLGETLRCLVESGSEVDLVDQDVVRTDPSFTTSRLTPPLHLRLGTRDKSDRFAPCLPTPSSRPVPSTVGLRAFFNLPCDGHMNAILPVAKGNSRVGSRSHGGAHLLRSAIGYDHPGLLPDDEIIGLEPHNLCWMSSTTRRSRICLVRSTNTIGCLLEKYSDVKVKPRAIPLPTKYRSQWAEHSAKYTRGRFWFLVRSTLRLRSSPFRKRTPDRSLCDRPPRSQQQQPAKLARSRYRSKFDVAAAFEQVRVIPEHVDRTGFATVTGTYTSRIFFDDVHVHSDTRRAHLRHIEILLMTLRHYRFYLGSNKSEWFLKVVRFLGAIISDDGIEVDPAKWERIRQWPTHTTRPTFSVSSAPAIDVVALERARAAGLDTVKSLVPATLRPIDGAKVTSGEHKISCSPMPVLNYHVTDKEFLAVVSACRAFEQHLIGYPSSSSPTTKPFARLKRRSYAKHPGTSAWCLELSRFDFEFEFIAGKNNPLPIRCLWEVKEGSPEDQVKENELEDMFFDGERHGFTTHGESLPEERPYTSPSPDRLPPALPDTYALKGRIAETKDVNGRDLGNLFLKEECHEFTTPGSPGSHRLAENIMEAVDSSTAPFSSHRRQSIDADADELDLLGAAADEVNDAPVVHRPPDPLPQPFLDAVIRAYAHDSQAQVIVDDPLSWPMFRVTEEGRILRVHR
ncbi:BZ3500_MvSof-1268-A1-R1_C050g00188 [Microbotryum saponariae]|uniref:BZ3500_MvSof-1268-A1-R1_C050g00188 protein n=1 Tax=Microbotryum saponariae TaxID=289078 RepID=A0A2X0MSQ4_9BASI|nr:BZ3500_MvSof-1268-A1-R1_C050g00188 [Microbotryum saponariae]